MSLCPNYCECDVCKHGWKVCEDCSGCEEEALLARNQIQHEDSVRRQRARLKLMSRQEEIDQHE
jgi:hypothetical protein